VRADDAEHRQDALVSPGRGVQHHPQPDRAAALALVAEVDAERGDEAAAVEVEAQ